MTVKAKHFPAGFTGASILASWPPLCVRGEDSERSSSGPHLAAGTSACSGEKCARAASGSSGRSCGCGLACCCCPRGLQTRGSSEEHKRGTISPDTLGWGAGAQLEFRRQIPWGESSANFWKRACSQASVAHLLIYREGIQMPLIVLTHPPSTPGPSLNLG